MLLRLHARRPLPTHPAHPLSTARARSNLDYEVVVVEDSSPDGTYEVALELQTIFGEEHMKILKRPGKMGLGSAYIDGLKLATGNFVVLMDADLSHHVRAAPPPHPLSPPRAQRFPHCHLLFFQPPPCLFCSQSSSLK